MSKTYLLTTLCALALAGAGALNAANEAAPPTTAEAGCPEQVVGEAINGWCLVHDGKGGVCACKGGERISLYNSGKAQLQVETMKEHWICRAGGYSDGKATTFVIRADAGAQQPGLVFVLSPGSLDTYLQETTEAGGDLYIRFRHRTSHKLTWETDFTIPKEIPHELKGRLPYISTMGGDRRPPRGGGVPYQQLPLPGGESLIIEDIGSGTYVWLYSILNKEGRVSRRAKPTHTHAGAMVLGEGTCTLCDEKGKPMTTLPIQEGDSAPVEFHSFYGQGFGVMLERPVSVEREGGKYFLIRGPVRVEVGFATPEVQQEVDALYDKPQAKADGYAESHCAILHEEISCTGQPRVSRWCTEEDLRHSGLKQPDGTFRLQHKVILHHVRYCP